MILQRWGAHCSKIAAKANKSLSHIMRRSLKPCSAKVKEGAYMTLVRPTLEYASSSWNPYTDSDVKRLQQIQKNAARFVCYNYNITKSTSSLVTSLGWDTLEHRRLFNQSVLFYKFHNNLVNCQTPSPVKSTEKITSTHGISPTYLLPITDKCLSSNYSFFPRVTRVWNLLPYGVTSSSTLSCFRRSALPAIRSLKVPSHLHRL